MDAYIKKGNFMMTEDENYVPKKFLRKVIAALCSITAKEIQEAVHVSSGYVSRHLNGDRNCLEIDIYMIERAFNIKIKDYIVL